MDTIDRSATSVPRMSVVLVTAGTFGSLRRTVRHLRAQTAQHELEIIVVASSQQAVTEHVREGELDGFHTVRIVEAQKPITNLDKACAEGIHAATASVVALVEDHAYPDTGWAEAMIRAHQGPWGVVGSTMANANPDSAVSWMNLLIAYGTVTEPVAGGEVPMLPGHNISFKRELLTARGSALADRLGRDGGLLQDLSRAGVRFYLEPAARMYHANPSKLSSTFALRFSAGRLYGGVSARTTWSTRKRLFYLAAGPVVPLVNFQRARRDLKKNGRGGAGGHRLYPLLFVGYLLDGAGQMFGNIFGPGGTAKMLAEFEFDRLRHLNARDRRLLTE